MKQVRCIETGETYDSAAIAAKAVGVTPGMLNHVLKGRQKTAAGYTWEYTGARVTGKRKKRGPRNRDWRDENGNRYVTLNDLAESKGITSSRAAYLLNKHDSRVFMNEWLHEDVTVVTFAWSDPYWCINDVRFLLRNEAVRYGRKIINHIPQMKMHKMLDNAYRTGQSVTMQFGPRGWVEGGGDLFAPIQS